MAPAIRGLLVFQIAGKYPWVIASDARGNHVYVVNEDSASISIVDGAAASGVTRNARSVPVGDIPFAIGVNPETNRVYALTYWTPSMVGPPSGRCQKSSIRPWIFGGASSTSGPVSLRSAKPRQ